MNYGLTDNTIEKIQTVLSNYPEVEKAILYGPRAKGNFKPASDIDITLVGKMLNLTILNRLELDLDDLLLPYKIDLSIFEQLKNVELIKIVEKEGEALYSKV